MEEKRNSFATETTDKSSFSSVSSEKSQKVADNFEPIDIEGQKETGIWVHRPGSEVSQIWEPRKGKSRFVDTQILGEPNTSRNSSLVASGSQNSSSTDENPDDKQRMGKVRRGLQKFSSVFHRSPKKDDHSGSLESIQSPRVNIKAVNARNIGVKFVVEEDHAPPAMENILKEEDLSSGESGSESPTKGNIKDKAKGFFKHAEKSARTLRNALSRKGSRRYPADSAEVTDKGILADSDSSDDESPPSGKVEKIPVASDVVVRDGGNESSSSQDHLVQTGEIDTRIDAKSPMETISPQSLETLNNRVDSPDNKSNVESSKLKLDEGDLEVQTK